MRTWKWLILIGFAFSLSGSPCFAAPVAERFAYLSVRFAEFSDREAINTDANDCPGPRCRFGPLSTLPLGAQIAIGAIIFLGSVVGAAIAGKGFFDSRFGEAYLIILASCLLAGTFGIIALASGLATL